MKVKWYGTATLLFESGDTRILLDPYLRSHNPALPPVPVEEARTADAIFITHPHLDHFMDIDAFTEGGGKRVFVSQNGIAHARENGLNADCMQAIDANEEYSVGAFTVRTYRSKHCRFDAGTVLGVVFAPRTWLHAKTAVRLLSTTKRYRIADDVFALEISDGQKRAMVLGSAGYDENTEYPQEADLLVFPYQGRTGMHRYMQPFLSMFRPKAVMADHFDDAFPPLTHAMNMKKFAPTVQKSLPSARAIVPTEGEWYEV